MPTPRSLLARAALNLLRGPGRAVAVDVAKELAGRARAVAPVEAPATRRERVAEGALWYSLLASLAALALVILNVDRLLGHGAPRAAIRLSLGTVLFVEGVALVKDWQGARTRVARRAHRRYALARVGRRWSSALNHGGLTLLGIALLAAGVLDLLRGALDL